MAKNAKNIEKLFQLMKKYQISGVKLEGIEIIKNLHDLPEAKKQTPEKNGDNDQFLKEFDKWAPPTL